MSDDGAGVEIAIVGMACRFPGAPDVDAFWENLQAGRETVTTLSDDELRAAGTREDELSDPAYVKVAQRIDDLAGFDAGLFGVPRDEAEVLDPQQRHFLECSLTALEHAGHDPATFDGAIGLFAGAGMNHYLLHNLAGRYRSGSAVGHYRLMITNDKDFLTTRVSYKLDLRGPSVAVNTACSTSLVAVHQAVLSLLSGDADMALAGAVHLRVPQDTGYAFQEGMIFSPDGHCRPFDADGGGTVIGSGVGVVVLRRLEDAIADGDTIHAVVRGSAVTNDGSAKQGYTAPSVDRQAATIAEALRVAGAAPESVSYVEAHGTATPLGDPIEVAALGEAFGHVPGHECVLGSVKGSVGHLDTAAGMAGLIKTVLMLRHATLVPSLNYHSPNPDIDFADGPFRVGTELAKWPAGPDGSPRRAGVSSFGIGGTNAHVVLEEPPAGAPVVAPRERELLLLSARTPEALERSTAHLARHLRADPGVDLGAAAATLAVGRAARAHRRAVVADGVDDASMSLALLDDDVVLTGSAPDGGAGAAWVFTGEGADGNAHDDHPEFAAAVDELGGPELSNPDGLVARVLHGIGSAAVWRAWGITPQAVVGIGDGRFAAACAAGVLTPRDAVALARAVESGQDGPDVACAAPAVALALTGAGEPCRWLGADESVAPRSWTPSDGAPDDEAADALLDDAGLVGLDADPADGDLLTAAASAWVNGAPLDRRAVVGAGRVRRIPLPTYPFEHETYWVEPPADLTAHGPLPTAGTSPEASPAADTAGLAGAVAAADAAERERLIREFLDREMSLVLRLDGDGPDPHANLFELDVDSLILIDVVARLGTALGRQVPASMFVDHPTISGFACELVRSFDSDGSSDDTRLRSQRRTSRRAARART